MGVSCFYFKKQQFRPYISLPIFCRQMQFLHGYYLLICASLSYKMEILKMTHLKVLQLNEIFGVQAKLRQRQLCSQNS
jgi:hypothetical protein